jgi:hypothetical protein
VANNVIGVDVVLVAGLDVVATVIGERHYRTDVVDGNMSEGTGDGIDGTLSDADDSSTTDGADIDAVERDDIRK